MTDRDVVLRKIRALLQKTVANGCPVAEALAAHAKAEALIDKYQVSHEELYGTGPGPQSREPGPAEPKQQEQQRRQQDREQQRRQQEQEQQRRQAEPERAAEVRARWPQVQEVVGVVLLVLVVGAIVLGEQHTDALHTVLPPAPAPPVAGPPAQSPAREKAEREAAPRVIPHVTYVPGPTIGAQTQLAAPLPQQPHLKRIPLRRNGNAYFVSVLVNQTLALDFEVDTGAGIVSVPLDVSETLAHYSSMSKSDIGIVDSYTLADGSTIKMMQVRFASMQIGKGDDAVIAHGVVGAIGDKNTSLLLGRSFLQQFKSTTIDHQANELIIDDTPNPNAPVQHFTPAPPEAFNEPAPQQPQQQPYGDSQAYARPQQQQPPYQQPYQQPYDSQAYAPPQQQQPPYQQPYQQPYYQPQPPPQAYAPPPAYYPPPAPCPACVIGGLFGGILGGAITGHRGYGYRGGWRR